MVVSFISEGIANADCHWHAHRQRPHVPVVKSFRASDRSQSCAVAGAWPATYIGMTDQLQVGQPAENRGHPKERHACQDQQSDVDFFLAPWFLGLGSRSGRLEDYFETRWVSGARPQPANLGSAVRRTSRADWTWEASKFEYSSTCEGFRPLQPQLMRDRFNSAWIRQVSIFSSAGHSAPLPASAWPSGLPVESSGQCSEMLVDIQHEEHGHKSRPAPPRL